MTMATETIQKTLTLEQIRDELFNIAAFLVGEGDAAEIAARKLRALAQAEWQLSKRLEHLKVQSEGEIPDILDCLDYTAKTPQSEFVDECGPLPQCRKCGLVVGVCECRKPVF